MSVKAVIDLGTNSIKLLVAEVSGGTVKPIFTGNEVTRLGDGFYPTRQLQPEAIARSAQAVAAMVRQAAEFTVEAPRVIATSAAREALNQQEFVATMKEQTGLKVEIVTGKQEAKWVFQGVSSDLTLAGMPLMVFDLGGGSTEIILGEAGVIHFERSYELGSLRMLHDIPLSNPPTAAEWALCQTSVKDYLHWEVAPALEPVLRKFAEHGCQLVATGGNVSVLVKVARFLAHVTPDRTAPKTLILTDVCQAMEWLWRLSIEERRAIPKMPPQRADTILPAAVIVAAMMRRFQFSTLTVSKRGMRYGALLDSLAASGPTSMMPALITPATTSALSSHQADPSQVMA